MQLAATLRLRASHPQLTRPAHTLHPAGFVPPALLALLVLGFAPTRHWLAAALVLGATLGLYAALTLCCRGRRAVLRRGGRGGAGGRGRSLGRTEGRTPLSRAAADEAEGEDAESDAQFDARLQREMRRVCTVGGGTSHTQLYGGGGEGSGVEMGESSWWPRPLPQAYARATLPAEPEPEERISAAEIVSAFEVDDDGRASPSDEQLAAGELPPMADPLGPLRPPPAPAAAPNPGRRFPSPPQRHSAQTTRPLGGAPAVPGGEVQMAEVQVACALADSLFAEGRGESV